MADFMGITASSGTKIAANKRVGITEYLKKFCFGGEITAQLEEDECFHFYGYDWPFIRLVNDEDSDNDVGDDFYEGLKQFVGKKPIIIQMVGYEKCRFPLSSMEIVITKKKVTYNGFKN